MVSEDDQVFDNDVETAMEAVWEALRGCDAGAATLVLAFYLGKVIKGSRDPKKLTAHIVAYLAQLVEDK